MMKTGECSKRLNLTYSRREHCGGIVRESGSGKSIKAMAIAGLLRRHDMKKSGEILFEGTELLHETFLIETVSGQ